MRYSARTVFLAQKLHRRVKIAKNRILYRAAGRVRLTARRMIRVVAHDRPSKAPAPPHAHKPEGIRTIVYSVQEALGYAVVGPLKFSNSRYWDEPVPHMHEFGGQFKSRKTTAKYPKRPYMSRAVKKLEDGGYFDKDVNVSVSEQF